MKKTRLTMLAMLATFSSAFFFSNSAYAEVTTLTVSNSGETISFDKIKPSGSGTVTKATDSLSVNTNCTEGIDLYMSTQNGSSHGTSLVNNTANSNNEITTLSGTTIGDSSTAKALSNNTWGFNTVDNNTYYGLPTYANALSHAVYSGTDSSIPIYYGAKVTSSMATGKYNGSVLYTVLVNMNCNNYTVEYDINTPEGAEGSIVSSTPPDDTILTFNKKSKLAENTFEITGYNFLGWSLDPTATTPEYDANTTEYYGSDIALAASADPGSTITMYAIWEEATIYMQDWSADLGCSKLSIGGTITLTDKRDNSKYTVKKFGSGSDVECWMTQNLILGHDKGYALTSADTNIPDSTTYYLPSAGHMGSVTSSSTITSTAGVDFGTLNENYAKVQYRASGTTDNDAGSPVPEDTGYYNFYAISLGYSGHSTGSSAYGDTPRDICPSGWQLPRGNNASTYSFYWLDTTVFGGSGSDRIDTTTRDEYLNQASFNYTGYYDGSNKLKQVGSSGAWWSSTNESAYNAYYFFLSHDGGVVLRNRYSKYNGYSVRCIDQNSRVSGYMQDFDTNTELPNEADSTYLVDKRDGKRYAVKRLPDGKVWMMQNLTIGSTVTSNNGMTLTNQDTNIRIDDDTTYYLPPADKQSTGTITQAPNASGNPTTTNFTGEDAHAKTRFRTSGSGGTNDSDTGYYNFYTATLGYSYSGDGKSYGTSPQDICPKGWRMPRTTDSGTNVTAIDTTNDFTYLARTYSTSNWDGNPTGTSSYYYNSANSTLVDAMSKNTASPLTTTTANNYAGFSYTGFGYNSSSATDLGSYGLYWSASIYTTYQSYSLRLSSSSVYPQYNSNKNLGYAVRCIAKDTRTLLDITYMQDISDVIISNTPTNTVATLTDKRDNHEYKVKKLLGDKVWMINNLTISATDMAVSALDSTNTNIPTSDSNSYYLPPQNARYVSSGNLNNSAVKSASSSVDFSSSYPNYLQIGFRAKNTTNNSASKPVPEDTAYYNFYTATLGYSYYNDGKTSGSSPRDICPKGWRLPWTSDSGTRQGSADFYKLALSYNGNSGVWENYIDPTGTGSSNPYTSNSVVHTGMIDGDASSTNNSYVGFTYAGAYDSTLLGAVGSYGYYWSSSIQNSYSTYFFEFTTSTVYPQNSTVKYLGVPIRCIAGS